jgi:hypothetical protein
MKLLSVLVLGICLTGVSYAQDDVKPFQEIAYNITQKEMKSEEWKAFLKKTKDRFATWESDNHGGDINQFLNDKLLEIAPSVKGGNIKALKNFVFWLALYHEFKQLPPEYIREVKPEYRQEIEGFLNDMNWERAAQMIKDNVKKYDEEQKAKAKEKKK